MILIFLANNGILHWMLGISSMTWIWCVGWFQSNKEEFANLCNAISFKSERVDEVSCIHVCIWLTCLILIFLYHVCILRWIYGKCKCAKCMSLVVVDQFVKRVGPLRMRVDVVWDYIIIIGGSMSQSFGPSAYIVVNVWEGFWV